jgi:hypothetical protein
MKKTKNPTNLYSRFHGTPPLRTRPVSYKQPSAGERLVKIGRIVEIVYHPEPPSQHSKSLYSHKFGDYGDRMGKNKPILAVSQDGKQLYIINDAANPIFGERGIVG